MVDILNATFSNAFFREEKWLYLDTKFNWNLFLIHVIDNKLASVQTNWGDGFRARRNRRPIVRNAILALSDKWLSLDTRPMD